MSLAIDWRLVAGALRTGVSASIQAVILSWMIGPFPYWITTETICGTCCAHTRASDLLRATFAYLMAAMTDAERDAIVVGL